MVQALGVHTVFTGYLEGVDGTVARGTCLVLNAAGTKWRVGTTANKAAAGRSCGCLAYTAGDDDNTAVEVMFCGVVSAEISGLSTGDASPIRVSTTGTIERVASPTVSDEVIGRCDADGVCYINFSTQSEILAAGQPPASPSRSAQINNAGAFGAAGQGSTATTTITNPASTDDWRHPSGGGDQIVRGASIFDVWRHQYSGGEDALLRGYGAASFQRILDYAVKRWFAEAGAAASGNIANAFFDCIGAAGHADFASYAAAIWGPNLIGYNGVTAVAQGMLGGGNGGVVALPVVTTAPTGNPSAPGAAVLWGDASTYALLVRNRSGDIRDLFYGRESVNSTTGTQSDLATSASGIEYNTLTFTGATSTITGLTGGRAGRSVNLHVKSGSTTTFANDATSTAANRLLTGTGADVAVVGPARLTASYDVNVARWILDSAMSAVGVELVNGTSGTQSDVTTTSGGDEAGTIVFTASTTSVTGFAGGRAGRTLVIIAEDNGVAVTLKSQTTSSAANQIVTPRGEDIVLVGPAALVLEYSVNNTNWFVVTPPSILDREASVAVAGSNVTLTATESTAKSIILTGTPGATRTISWVAPIANTVQDVLVYNNTNAAQTLQLAGGGGTTHSLSAKDTVVYDYGSSTILRHAVLVRITSNGVFPVSQWSYTS